MKTGLTSLLAILALACPAAWAGEQAPDEKIFEDGSIYGMATAYEQNIRYDYELLKMIEGSPVKGIEQLREKLVTGMNSYLSTIGSMIEDCEAGRIMSPRSMEILAAADAREKTILGDRDYAEAGVRMSRYWQDFRKERREKQWTFATKSSEVNASFERKVDKALGALIGGGAFCSRN